MLPSVKGKRTPKRNLKHGRKGVSKSDLVEAEDKGNSDIPSPEPTSVSKADELNSGEVSYQFLIFLYVCAGRLWSLDQMTYRHPIKKGLDGEVLGSAMFGCMSCVLIRKNLQLYLFTQGKC